MGMSDWFKTKQNMDEALLPPPTRPAPEMPVMIEERKKDIGEPVISLLKSLEVLDDWAIKIVETQYHDSKSIIKHKNHEGLELLVVGRSQTYRTPIGEITTQMCDRDFRPYEKIPKISDYSVLVGWMTDDEKDAVDIAVSDFIVRYVEYEKNLRNAKERAKFMILTVPSGTIIGG